jgi:transcriptional regulator with XRE-family HTH domain
VLKERLSIPFLLTNELFFDMIFLKGGDSVKDRIKLLRKELELTQEKFSERLGIKRNTIAKYETGINEPTNAVISLICREFNVNEQWLRTGEGEMFRVLPEEDELSIYIEDLLMGTEDSVHKAIKAFLLAYGRMNDPSKKVMNELIDNWLEEMQKGRD